MVLGITSLDPKKCSEPCDKLAKMFNEMKPIMKGFYETYMLEADSTLEDKNGKEVKVLDFFNITDRRLPGVAIFPYGARSVTLGKPRHYGKGEEAKVGFDNEVFQQEMMRTKLWETTVPMLLNQTYAEQLIASYQIKPKEVHNIFLAQVPPMHRHTHVHVSPAGSAV